MKQKILKDIETFSKIFIYRHEKPDPDAIGSQAGLAELIKHNYPNKRVILSGEMEPSLKFLAEWDDNPGVPDEESLVIICDTANMERIDGTGWENGKKLIKIDHHPEVEDYGDIIWVRTKASSTCEMIIDLALTGKESFGWEWTTEAARLLYAGIIGDTGRFQFPNTTPDTLRYAAEVLEYGFDTTELFTRFYENEEALIRLKGRVLQDFQLTENGLGVMYITKQMLDEYGVSVNESSAVIGAFADTQGIKAWVFFVEDEDNNNYRVRLRSKGPVINEVAANHRGGGHPMAAGAKAEDRKETEEIIKELDDLCKDFSFEK